MEPVALAVSLLIGSALARAVRGSAVGPGRQAAVLFVALAVATWVVGQRAGAAPRLLTSFLFELRSVANAVALGVLATVAVMPPTRSSAGRPSLDSAVVITALPALAVLPLSRQVRGRLHRRARERVVVVGTGAVAEAVNRRVALHPDLLLVGTVDDGDDPSLLGPLRDLARICEEHDVTRVLVAFSRTPSHESLDVLRTLHPGICISVVPRLFELLNWNAGVEELDGLPLLHVPRPQLTVSGRFAKRALDVVAASTALVVFSPVLLLAALAIKLDSPGPVLFRQARTGRHGRTFSILKLRTMRAGAEAEREDLAVCSEVDGPIFKIRRDPRVTRVGRLLRATSLDELPQLINVVKGDMALVGPRPLPVAEAERITGWALPRTLVRPGITGLWQISGRTDLAFEDLQRLDLAYLSSWTIWWDLRILLQTPVRVLRRVGAY